MTIQELSERYDIGIEKLKYFSKNNLIGTNKKYDESDVKKLNLICILYEMGLPAKNIEIFLQLDAEQKYGEQLNLLAEHRCKLSDDIHTQQKALDRLDYIVYEIKRQMEQ